MCVCVCGLQTLSVLAGEGSTAVSTTPTGAKFKVYKRHTVDNCECPIIIQVASFPLALNYTYNLEMNNELYQLRN